MLEEAMTTYVRSETTEHAVILDLLINEISDKLTTQGAPNNGSNKNEVSQCEVMSKQALTNTDKNNFKDFLGIMKGRKSAEVNVNNSIKVQCWIRNSDSKDTDFYIMTFKKIADIEAETTNDLANSPVKSLQTRSQILENPMFLKNNSKSSLLNLYKPSAPAKQTKDKVEGLARQKKDKKEKPESFELLDNDEYGYISVISFLKSRLIKFRTLKHLRMSLVFAFVLIFFSIGTFMAHFFVKVSFLNALQKQKKMIYNFAILKKSVSVLCSTNFLQSNSAFERLWRQNPIYYQYIVT
jgi:hypothetical protein